MSRWTRSLRGANVTHGLRSTYVTYRCRCEACTAANCAYQLVANAERKDRLTRGEVTIMHGTANAYSNYRCRCPQCRAFQSERMRAWKAHRKAVGS